ncbi:MAG: DUF1501 domain-containing protein, partial [Verrucomicrobiota bacterium]|nr:DUF1501 domain-containing protein [Verrucomicrobiota bacterium]
IQADTEVTKVQQMPDLSFSIEAKQRRMRKPQKFTAKRVVMAGGGMKRGYIHGTSDPTGSEPDENPVSVPDWAATVWTLMGIDPRRRLAGPGNRPMPINYDGEVLKDALA